MKNKFLKWLAIFAYKQIKDDPKAIKIGIPGVRDVNDKCRSYSPGQKAEFRGFNHCTGDGHYLCSECRFHVSETIIIS